MAVPLGLAAAIAALPEDDRFKLVEGWIEREEQAWSFQFSARLSVEASEHMPEWSGWHLVVSDLGSDPDIMIYPDAADGIVATFPHQDFNDEPEAGVPWRTGKPCLERPASIFRREGWAGEPADLADRLVWRIARLLSWMDAAATDTLLCEGDPLELPTYPSFDATATIGFSETEADLEWWIGRNEAWGFATLSALPGAWDTQVISDFMDPQRRTIRKVTWSKAIPVDNGRVDAVWVLLPAPLVFAPWRTAATWRELTAICANLKIDLPEILTSAGARLRRIQRPKHASPVHLIVGFPLMERVGGEACRIHWTAIRGMRLCTRDDVRRGYKGTAQARQAWDREFAVSNRALGWRRTANWAPDQLRKRGKAEEAVRAKSVLILGVGTLGAAIAESLLRMGVTKMGLVDGDVMLVGNLSRHVLTMADVGQGKAQAMATRLNLATPDAAVEAFPLSFPPDNAKDAEQMRRWDVIIDCTASDAVARAMGHFQWGGEKLFVSLGMTWEARGLFAYSASETAFPAVDAMERFLEASPALDDVSVGDMEGIGCWHPVFPATADDVNLWAAVGAKFVRRAVVDAHRKAVLFLQKEDGTVERRDI
ncbi:ThiF family adenylyltransferase [Acuticoccus sediminis]|uniref:ThiF family adenylyltransferase n=1 Tax=Acuticoccus sediminis TaxID=2184697 RepID=UPI001CFE221D|nr:ThiF family adenylyltransferase [Acuticoccus sediminis]